MYEYNDYVVANNILEDIKKQYSPPSKIDTIDEKLDYIRIQNILRSLTDCQFLLSIEKEKLNNVKIELGKNRLCLYIYDAKYTNNRKIECYENLTKEQVIQKISEGISNNNLFEFELNNKKFTTATAELKAEDFI